MLYAIVYVCALGVQQCTPQSAESFYTFPCESQTPMGCLREAYVQFAQTALYNPKQVPTVQLAHK